MCLIHSTNKKQRNNKLKIAKKTYAPGILGPHGCRKSKTTHCLREETS
jgi:hypothetical protein